MSKTHDKPERIIDAAVRRFSHFGFHKTTLAEIAEDAGLSRQSLLYYFRDKQALANAVVDAIGQEYLATLNDALSLTRNFEEVLIALVDIRFTYFEKFYMIFSELHSSDTNRSTVMNAKQSIIERESDLLAKFYKKAVDTGEIESKDARELIQLIQQTLEAYQGSANKNRNFPEAGDMKELMDKQKKLVQLLYTGIRA